MQREREEKTPTILEEGGSFLASRICDEDIRKEGKGRLLLRW